MTCELSRDGVPAIAPSFRFQWEEVQNCYVILYPEGMVKLSGSAGEIMKRCDGTATIAEIIDALQQDFPGADLRQDVHNFLETAKNHGWIRIKQS